MTPSWRTCGVAHSLYSSLTKADSILEDFEMLVLRSAIYFLIDCDDLWKKWPFLFLYGIWWCESSDWLSSLSFSMIFFILDLIRDYLWPLSSSNRGGWQEIPGLTLNFRFCNPHPCLVRSCRSPWTYQLPGHWQTSQSLHMDMLRLGAWWPVPCCLVQSGVASRAQRSGRHRPDNNGLLIICFDCLCC